MMTDYRFFNGKNEKLNIRNLYPLELEKIKKVKALTICTMITIVLAVSSFELEAKTVFQSNFENGVTLGTPRIIKSHWWQDISYDSLAGQLPRKSVQRVQFLVGSEDVTTLSDLSNYIKSEIQNVNDANGNPTKAWLMRLGKKYTSGPPYYTSKRISLNVDSGESESNDHSDLYIKYDMKFIPEFEKSMISNSWTNIWENLVAGNTNKLLVIRLAADSPLIWKLESHTDIPIYNKETPVPLNQWFKIEIYYKHSLNADGKIKVYLNGETLFDYTGSTADTGGVIATNLLKTYSNRSNVGHWVDNLVVIDFPPETFQIPLDDSAVPNSPKGLRIVN